ncbi:DUF4440 domain-containing protein [Clostridium sp. LIBA-8841]|uniref:nuclear transport factor 2 family protein n=1 Tax=Clostridium sp. LIBA-8841 TaxID=2987530 RepID=UPI002AC5137F|nr:DUF4440 domain-containing protein [Clostridium sp. LIBA-8841]MDZ5253809.1 DUF4440 domain-containing protein [Clostridium sp. LIBA-8841]
MNSVREEIFQLENDLLKADVRKSAEKINEIVADDFVEFCSSGSEYHYKNGDIFQAEDDYKNLDWEIFNFEVRELSEDCVLATYKVVKHDEIDERKRYFLRSSIWKEENGKWKIFFNQGTLLPNERIRN